MGCAIFHSKRHDVVSNGCFKNDSCFLSKCLKVYILEVQFFMLLFKC